MIRMRASIGVLLLLSITLPASAELTQVLKVEAQPLQSQVQRLADALEFLGEPLTPEEQKQLDEALKLDDAESIAAIQKLFDQRTLAGVHINPESRVKVARGPAAAELNEQGWRVFLVKNTQ